MSHDKPSAGTANAALKLPSASGMGSATERSSGFRTAVGAPSDSRSQRHETVGALPIHDNGAESLIAEANAQLDQEAAHHLDHPLAILLAQRDQALRALAAERTAAQQIETRLRTEQDALAAQLLGQHEAEARSLLAQVAEKTEELSRARALAPAPASPDTSEEVAALRRQVSDLQAQLQAAFAEVDETREDAARLQDERDEAIRAIDDVRLELSSELDQSRDEANELQLQLEKQIRAREDDAERAQADAIGLNEELAEARRTLDERNADIHRLREKLEGFEVVHSRLPPPQLSTELQEARTEIQRLRKQLIDSKREVTRHVKELNALRSPESTLPSNPFSGVPPSSPPLGSPPPPPPMRGPRAPK